MLVTVVDEGSFSAAARKLRRVQSAVSHAMKSLEEELGVELWDRRTKRPTLTSEGRAVLTSARRVLGEADDLRRVARGLQGGLEASVSICVDALFPVAALVSTCSEFAAEFPAVELRVRTETMGDVAERVLDKSCQIGVAGPHARASGLEQHHLTTVRMVPVASPSHPLASVKGRIPMRELERQTQIVLSERGEGRSPDQGVLSARTWRVADLSTKHAMLVAGLGWGNMPEGVLRTDFAKKRLVRIRPSAWGSLDLQLALVHERGLAPGIATLWLIERLKKNCALSSS